MTGTESDSSPEVDTHPLVVGLTGGIGSGKTTVADGFSALGIPVIDADQIAHELVEPGQPALDKIIAAFGVDCLTADGHLDRQSIREIVFKDELQRHRLEAILHPEIRQQIRSLIASIRTPYCIVVIPLLLETGQQDLVQRILVVDTPEEKQISRVAVRDKLSHNVVTAIMNSQLDRDTRLAAADDVIINDNGLESLPGKIAALHTRYLELSHGN
ncbi:MAG: dephospho-CoA kinase [Gammaproteobacteria bacterium]|nr:dephospho-CoA kinase [Gammaproteobacteria bacterium]